MPAHLSHNAVLCSIANREGHDTANCQQAISRYHSLLPTKQMV